MEDVLAFEGGERRELKVTQIQARRPQEANPTWTFFD